MKKQSFVIILLSLLLIGKYAVWADEKPNTETIEQSDANEVENETEENPEIDEETKNPEKSTSQAPEKKSLNESQASKASTSKTKEKTTTKNKIAKASIKKPENLIFQDNQLEIYKMKTGMSRDWLSPYYSFHKVLLVNLTDSEIKVNGDILNKVQKQEARSKVAQIVEEKKARSRAASSAGMVNGGLVGAAFSAGSLATDISTDRGERELLGQINKLIDDKPFLVTVPAKEEMTFSFLFTKQKDAQPEILLAYKKSESDLNAEKTFIIKNFDEALGKRLLVDNNLYGYAYFDQKISDKKIGAYFVNSPIIKPAKPTKKNTKKEIKENQEQAEIVDKSYETAAYIEPINLMLPTEEEKPENTDKTNKPANKKSKAKKPTTIQKLEGLTSSHIYPQKDFRIFVYQNIKKQPNRSSIDLVKLAINKKDNFRSIRTNNNFISFSLKEIKPGISELKPSSVLAPGEYLLIDQDQDLGIDFTIEKPAVVKPKTNKTK